MSENVNVNALNWEGLAPLLIVFWKQSTEILQLVSILLERPDLQFDVTDGVERSSNGMQALSKQELARCRVSASRTRYSRQQLKQWRW